MYIVYFYLTEYLVELFVCYQSFKEEEYVSHPHIPGMRVCPRLATLSKEDLARLQVVQINRELFAKAALK